MKEKTVLITGASSGIGLSCAEVFAREGADLILTARRIERLEALKERLEATHNISCYAAQLDVRDRDMVQDFVGALPAQFSDIDVLLNNAGLARGVGLVQDGNPDDWDEMIDTNIKGLLSMTRAVVPGMIDRGRGHIINIGSIAGRHVYSSGTVYCSTKFAVRALTQGMAMDLVATPIRVSTVDPGLVETEFSMVRHRGNTEKAAEVYKRMTPLTADDVAEAVLFCVTRPKHVNISEMVILPADQASVNNVHRR